ncbi:MAG: GGDEF domain-containing protein [bacterium]
MSENKENKQQKRKSLFSRRQLPNENEKKNGDSETAASALLKLLNTPININFSPFTVGAAFDEFLKQLLGVGHYSLKLDENCIDPLLLESHVIPSKMLAGSGPHIASCPAFSGKTLVTRNATPATLCATCGVDCAIGSGMIRFPITLDGAVCGTFTLCLSGEPLDLENTDFNSAICRIIANATENALLREFNRQLEISDSLTRVSNYRYFMKTMEQELERSRRYDHPFSLILADIAHMKIINTRYGVEIGDTILKETAQILRKCVRSTDTVARYSGGKFAIILTETTREGAERVCDKIHDTFAKFSMQHPDQNHEIKVEVNMGTAAFPEDAILMSRLILSAENHLQRKKSGIIYPDSIPPGGQ